MNKINNILTNFLELHNFLNFDFLPTSIPYYDLSWPQFKISRIILHLSIIVKQCFNCLVLSGKL